MISPQEIINRVRMAGVVGAGGAGFPTHIKLQNRVNAVIANGVECEPLLANDRFLMENYPHLVIRGLELLSLAVGASNNYIALKKKYQNAQSALQSARSSAEFILMSDYYPAGDEVEIVKTATGKTVPEAGIPIEVGALVNNIQTLLHIADAVEGNPVTQRFITVCGEVKSPSVIKVPIGSKIADVIAFCGGTTVEDYKVYIGGPMMGTMADPDTPVTKTTTGVFILPADHFLVQIRSRRMEYILRQAQSACTDCQQCTEICPRYLLGHEIQPHRIMRTVSFQLQDSEKVLEQAFLCSQCGACEYACPMMLSPRRVFKQTRDLLIQKGIKFNLRQSNYQEHPAREHRRLPASRLMTRLELSKYERKLISDYPESFIPREVKILLQQHLGAPAESLVHAGDKVLAGELIADIPAGKTGARFHSSITGKVKSVTQEAITVRAE